MSRVSSDIAVRSRMFSRSVSFNTAPGQLSCHHTHGAIDCTSAPIRTVADKSVHSSRPAPSELGPRDGRRDVHRSRRARPDYRVCIDGIIDGRSDIHENPVNLATRLFRGFARAPRLIKLLPYVRDRPVAGCREIHCLRRRCQADAVLVGGGAATGVGASRFARQG